MENRVIAGRYRITEKIGAGGMAEVYRAQDEVLGRSVAVKIMLPQYAADPTFAARFRQEAQAAANLSSPYIVNIYDWGQDEGTYYIVMEYIHGIDLKTAIVRRGAIEQHKVAEIGAQVCSALSVAHGYDIIHRDIKPHNIMVQPDGNAKVMDFGIARAGNTSLTQTNSVLGTAHYVSPEQAQGKTLTYASDLYSLGVVLYEAVCGRVPFDAPDAVAIAMKQVNEAPVPPSKYNPDIDPAFEAIIMRALEKNPRNRFGSANEMKSALNSYLSGRPVAFAQSADETIAIGSPVAPMAGGTAVMSSVGSGGRAAGSGGRYNNGQRARQVSNFQEEPPKKKWGLAAGIVAVIAVIAIIAAVFALSNCSGKTVPNVVGMTQADAEEAIVAAGFEIGTINQENSASVAAGKVISQTPKENKKAEEGSKINLVISKGPAEAAQVQVPDLTNMTQTQAEDALKAVGLVPKVTEGEHSDSVAAGKVFKQSPVALSTVAKGSTVTFSVSLGPETAEIPDVTGKSKEEATTILETAGFKVRVDEEYSATVKAGIVISQDPAAGQQMAKKNIVAIVVSKGAEPVAKVEVPNLIDMTLTQAQVACNSLGLSLNASGDMSGTVGDQSPAAGTMVDKGSAVNVTLEKTQGNNPTPSS